MGWHKAMNTCPAGYRLPTRQEFVSLFGGCDAKVMVGEYGRCNTCSNSDKCSSMFGKDSWYYWSSSSSAANPSLAWFVNFGFGYVDGYVVKDRDFNVRCVRSGP